MLPRPISKSTARGTERPRNPKSIWPPPAGAGKTRPSSAVFSRCRAYRTTTCAPVDFHLGQALFDSGQAAAAIGELEQAISLDSTYVPAYSLLGYILLLQGKARESSRPLQEALRLDPHFASAHFNLANCFLQLGRFDQALLELNAVLRAQPDDPAAQKTCL